MFELFDRKEQRVVAGAGPYKSRRRADLARDKKDNEYGAYRYSVRPVQPRQPGSAA